MLSTVMNWGRHSNMKWMTYVQTNLHIAQNYESFFMFTNYLITEPRAMWQHLALVGWVTNYSDQLHHYNGHTHNPAYRSCRWMKTHRSVSGHRTLQSQVWAPDWLGSKVEVEVSLAYYNTWLSSATWQTEPFIRDRLTHSASGGGGRIGLIDYELTGWITIVSLPWSTLTMNFETQLTHTVIFIYTYRHICFKSALLSPPREDQITAVCSCLNG